MASRLGQAASKLASQRLRGLASVLAERSASVSATNEPLAAASLRSFVSDSGVPAAASHVMRQSETEIAGPSQQAQQEAQQAQQQPSSTPPAGSADFSRKELLMVFTCSRCDTRAAKAFSKKSYQEGVVIVDCPGCHSKHLIADHLGWFGQKGTVEDFAAERGNMAVRKLADGTTEITVEDILGRLPGSKQGSSGEAGGGGS